MWCWVDSEFEFSFLAIVNRETFHEEGSETGSGAAAKGVEDEETLEAGALVGQLPNPVQHQVDDLLADGVVAPGVVVGGVLFASHQLLWVEQLPVCSSPDLVNDGGLQINKDSSRNMLTSSSLREEGVEAVISSSNGLVRGHLTIRLDTVLQTVELPTGITNLAPGLANVDRNTFSLNIKNKSV